MLPMSQFLSRALISTAAAQGMPLDHLALVARKACVSRSHQTITIGERVLGRLPSPGNCTHSRLKHTLSFWGRSLFACLTASA